MKNTPPQQEPTENIAYISVAPFVLNKKGQMLLVKRAKDPERGWDLPSEKIKSVVRNKEGKKVSGDTNFHEAIRRAVHEETGAPYKQIKIKPSATQLGCILGAALNEKKGKLILCVLVRLIGKIKFKSNNEICGHRWAGIGGNGKNSWTKAVTSKIARDRIALCLKILVEKEPRLMTYQHRGETLGQKPVAYRRLGEEALTVAWLKKHNLAPQQLGINVN